MNRTELVKFFQNYLKPFGRVIVNDLQKKFEDKPIIYLAVIRSGLNIEDESRSSMVYTVEIVYVPEVRNNSVTELYKIADIFEKSILGLQIPNSFVQDIEIVVDVLGNYVIFCNLDIVCFT